MSRKSKAYANSRGKNNRKFAYVPVEVIQSAAWGKLRPSQRNVVHCLAAQFVGNNNGDLTGALEVMKKFWLKSQATVWGSLELAQEVGLIEKTRQGGKNKCNLFALTWWPIDDCGGKMDAGFRVTKVASNKWRDYGK